MGSTGRTGETGGAAGRAGPVDEHALVFVAFINGHKSKFVTSVKMKMFVLQVI